VLVCSSSFEMVDVLLPLFVPVAPLVAVVLPCVAVGSLLLVVLPPLFVAVLVLVLELPELLLYEPLVLLFTLLPLLPFESAAATPARLRVRAAAKAATMILRCFLNFPSLRDRWLLIDGYCCGQRRLQPPSVRRVRHLLESETGPRLERTPLRSGRRRH